MSTEKIIWDNGSWRLKQIDVNLANGQTRSKTVVDHPGSVVLVPLLADNILLIKQFRPALGQTILELPAGTCHWGEDITACAHRELREETGYRAAQLTPLGLLWPAPGVSNETMHLFLATQLTPDPLPPDDDEQIELTPIPQQNIISRLLTERWPDAKTIAGLLRTAHHLNWLT
ncbi:MAG TPA: NUDIX hydrolase [Anaerolineae bacterium]|nr:NUDIX hydrolase [Anaerolineae bacterium]